MVDDPIASLADAVLTAGERALARAMRTIDDDADRGLRLLERLYPYTGRAYVVGVTGAPGAGKSSLVDRLVSAFRSRDARVGVVAVDPSSALTGGALLGDRIRMQRHFLDEGVFIRSLASRGQLGGLSRSAAGTVRVLDAAGFDVILIETVGVGQAELAVSRLAETSIVVVAPGLGDDVQASKAGILEIGDIFVVNKADRPDAGAAVRDLQQMLALGAPVRRRPRGGHGGHHADPGDRSLHDVSSVAQGGASDGPWTPPILRTVATRGEGIEAVVEACDAHRGWLAYAGRRDERLRRRDTEEVRALIDAAIRVRVDALATEAQADASGAPRVSPYAAAEALLRRVLID